MKTRLTLLLCIHLICPWFSAADTPVISQANSHQLNNSSENHAAQQGLNKLRSALTVLGNKSPITVELHTTFSDVHDDHLKQGEVSAILSASNEGFQLTYPATELLKIDKERTQLSTSEQDNDTDSIAPTLAAANKLKAIDLNKTLNMATELLLLMQRATFIADKSHYSPSAQRNLLTFELPIDMMLRNKRTRQYVDEFTATYKLYINAEGIPLRSELVFEGSGSAYLVLHMSAYGNQSETFQVVNNRLILASSESTKGSTSIFGDFERKQTKAMRLLTHTND